MAIRTVLTSGYGNGTFSGTIALVVRRGYTAPRVSSTGGFISKEADMTQDSKRC